MQLKFTVSEYKDCLKRARSALNLSRMDKGKDIVFEDLFFQAQQAAEKAIKALYIYYRTELPRTHNLVIIFTNCWGKRKILGLLE